MNGLSDSDSKHFEVSVASFVLSCSGGLCYRRQYSFLCCDIGPLVLNPQETRFPVVVCNTLSGHVYVGVFHDGPSTQIAMSLKIRILSEYLP